MTYRDPVADDAPALRMAVQRDLTRDALVITGTEPGDTLREVVADLGEVFTDYVDIDPGQRTGVAVVEDRPVLLLPESPSAARVGAVQLLRPLLKRLPIHRCLRIRRHERRWRSRSTVRTRSGRLLRSP